MAITKPYTFQAGTKARAGEVNQDFDILYSEVNRIGTEILNIDVDIQDIESSKANINGNATQRFQMANPEASYDGVNKTYLENAIANIKDYISGYVITKDTDNTIIVSPGSCYDSDFTTILTSTGNITKENTNQGASATYYVHVIGDATGRQVDILISTESISPALPTGYALYRNIGKFTTDEDSNISDVVYYGAKQATYNQIAGVAEIYINGTSWYRIWSVDSTGYRWCEQGGYTGAESVTYIKPFKDNNYTLTSADIRTSGASGTYYMIRSKSATGFTSYYDGSSHTRCWMACGYIV